MWTEIIDSLGGTSEVARLTNQKWSTVSNWRRRGIPWQWRKAVSDLAKQKRIAIPDNFFQAKPMPTPDRASKT